MTQKLSDILAINEEIAEYTYLETDPLTRRRQRHLFIDDQTWNPAYTYPRLAKFLRHGELMGGLSYDAMRHFAVDAIHAIEQSRRSGELDSSSAHLFADFYVARLQRLLLLKTAQEMAEPHAPSLKKVLRHRFKRLNQELYGTTHVATWQGIMNTERQRLMQVMGHPESANSITDKLTEFYSHISQSHTEPELIDQDLCATYQPLIAARYSKVLQSVPDTGASVKYDAQQCARIMQHALMAGGFRGWKVVVDGRKTNPSTEPLARTISLPANTRRNAQELRRLILHEQEVHARRAENGRAYTDMALLKTGTANYSAVEEGLGIFLEIMLTGSAESPAIYRARDRYITAGIIEGLDRGRPRDARATYEILWRVLAVRRLASGANLGLEATHRIKQQAYAHIENAFRGTDFVSPGIFYMKLKVYYEGLHKNVEFMRSISSNLSRFDDAFVGKYDHTSASERQRIQDALESPHGLPQTSAAPELQKI